MELPPDNPTGRVDGMEDSGVELFRKSNCYFYVAERDLEEKVKG